MKLETKFRVSEIGNEVPRQRNWKRSSASAKLETKFQFLILCLLCFLTPTLSAQETDRARAARQIKELKNGALIVRLPMKEAKLKALRGAAASTAKDKDKAFYERLIRQTIAERDTFNLVTMRAFQRYYTFCPLYFMPDTCTLALKSGVRQGIFVKDQLRYDPSIRFTAATLFFADYGFNGDLRLNAYVVSKPAGSELVTFPFPFASRIPFLKRTFVALNIGKDHYRTWYDFLAFSLNREHERFYKRQL